MKTKTNACSNPKHQRVVYVTRWRWYAPWIQHIDVECLDCAEEIETELEQQRLASGGW